jgi:hypothetical protein
LGEYPWVWVLLPCLILVIFCGNFFFLLIYLLFMVVCKHRWKLLVTVKRKKSKWKLVASWPRWKLVANWPTKYRKNLIHTVKLIKCVLDRLILYLSKKLSLFFNKSKNYEIINTLIKISLVL